MPLFLNHRVVFLHIPKTGGTSVCRSLRDHGDAPLYSDESYTGPGHSPQHSTYRELVKLNMVPQGFRVMAVVRNPYDRFVSEYNWRVGAGLVDPGMSQGQFAQDFFAGGRFDNHDLAQVEFTEGALVDRLLRFESMAGEFYANFGFALRHDNASTGAREIEPAAKELVALHWGRDFKEFGYAAEGS